MTVPSARPELEPSSARSAGQGWRSRRRRRLGLDRASTQLSWSRPAICRFPGTWTSIRAMRRRRISLHPVGSHSSRTNIPLHERPRSRKGETHLPGGFSPCQQPVTRPSRRSEIVQAFDQALRTAPAGIMPVWRYRQSATISFRATATIVIFRILPCRVPTRSRNHRDSPLSG